MVTILEVEEDVLRETKLPAHRLDRPDVCLPSGVVSGFSPDIVPLRVFLFFFFWPKSGLGRKGGDLIQGPIKWAGRNMNSPRSLVLLDSAFIVGAISRP